VKEGGEGRLTIWLDRIDQGCDCGGVEEVDLAGAGSVSADDWAIGVRRPHGAHLDQAFTRASEGSAGDCEVEVGWQLERVRKLVEWLPWCPALSSLALTCLPSKPG